MAMFSAVGNKDGVEVIEYEDLKKLINDYIDDADVTESLETRQKYIFHSFKSVYLKNPLIHIVDTLSFALTGINVEKRAKGTGLLAECIHQCKPASMDELELDTLLKFFCDRLKDHHSIQPIVVYAFLGIISYQNISNELIITMLQSLFAEVHIQSLVQADRRNVFNIFSNLLKTKIDVLKPFSSEFIFGFIQAMDSERDPRNLLICFENSFVVIKELDFSLFTEDLFEVLSCYFPVEFRAPKEDKYGIKKEDLVDSLRKCLTAEKSFAQYAVPLYLEKLSSDMMDSKLDSLVTFTECLNIYNPEDVALHINDIWIAIRKDYLLSDFAELATPYLDFIHRLVKCLSKAENSHPLMQMVDFLIKDCIQTLKDPEMTIAISCGNIILQVSNASQNVYQEIINRLISPIKAGLEKYTSIPQRTNMMEIITKLLSVDNTNIVANSLLMEFVDYLIPLLYSLVANCENTTLQILSLKCLENIIIKSSWFQNCDFDILAHHCFCPVQENVLLSQVLIGYKSFLEIISQKFPQIFKRQYLEVLERKMVENVEKKIISQCFFLLEYTSMENELMEEIYSYFNTFILIVSKIHFRNCVDVLHCYINILKKNKRTIAGTSFILPLFDLIKSINLSDNVWLIISRLLSECFKLLNLLERKEIYIFVNNMLSNQYKIDAKLFNSPINFQLGDNLLQFSTLLRGIFTQLNIDDLYVVDLDGIFWQLMQAVEKGVHDDAVLQNFGIVFGSIINKLPADSSITKKYLDLISNIIHKNNQCNYAIVLLSWMTKGLVLNWQSTTAVAIDFMLTSLKNEAVANVAASGFEIIVKEVEDAFTKESNSSIKLMYKQRYTQYVLPLLIQYYHDAQEEVKSFHMVAISNTLHAIPKQMLQKHLKSMMPLLMHSLATCNNTPITKSTLSTILSVLGENKDVISEYVPSLLGRLLNLITHSNMDVRILSLKSLAKLSSYTPHVVQPMKIDVIRKVRFVLDDKKRLVRMEAICCSNAWHLMSSVTE